MTETVPKCLVPIRGKPLLAIWLDLLERHGVEGVLINLHYLAARVVEFLESYQTAVRVETVHERRLVGSAGTVLANRKFVSGENDFLILYADNLTDVDLGAMTRFHRLHQSLLTLGVSRTDRPREKGIVVADADGKVIDFEEKPTNPRSDLANAGIYVASRDIFAALEQAGHENDVLDFGYHVLPRVVSRTYAYVMEDFLLDIGTPESYERAQRDWREP